jgi:hypothetical protein
MSNYINCLFDDVVEFNLIKLGIKLILILI